MDSKGNVTGLRSLPRRQVVITMAGVMLAMFLSSLDQTIVGTAMPQIIADLGGFAHYTWITTAYLVTSTVVIPITGKLIDMYGRKSFYTVGLVVFVVGSVLCGFSQTMTQIIFFRGFQGIGAGIMIANAFTVVGDLFPPAERGKYQGFIAAVFGLSAVIGPTLGGFLTDSLSWHWIFFVNVPLGIIIIFLFIFFFPNIRPSLTKHQVDYPGLVTIVLTVVPAMLALSWAGVEYPWLSAPIIGMFIFSLAMGILFVIIESRSQEPIIPPSLFRNGIISLSIVVTFLTGIGMFGGIIFLPLFFQGVLDLSATASGTFLTPMMLGLVGGAFISGQLLSRAGGHYRIQGAIGVAIMAGGMALLSQMTMETTYTRAVTNIVVTGFGLGMTMPTYTIAVQNAVPYRILGVATSSVVFFRSIGGTIGLAVFGSVMTNRFAAEFIGHLPPAAKALIPQEQLNSLAHNPQALVSAEAQTALKNTLEQMGPSGATLYNEIIQVLHQALSTALSEIFWIGLGIVAVGLIASLFIREIPLRRQHGDSELAKGDQPPNGRGAS